MSDPQDPLLTEHLEAALEASCAALVELQLLRGLTDEGEQIVGPVSCAIAALRGAIGELREAQTGQSNPLASGFVLDRETEVPPAHQSQEASERLQRSRRLVERALTTLASGRPRGERGAPRSPLLLPNAPGPLGKG